MRSRYYFLILSILFFSYCKKETHSNTSLIGRWQETEYNEGMVTPGWVPTITNRVIEFKANGRLEGYPNLDRFAMLSDSTVQVWSNNSIYVFTWKIEEITSSKLELWYSCIEGCGARFKAVK